MLLHDENEIRKSFAVFNDSFTEVRILKDKYSASGYFSDADSLLKAMKPHAKREDVNFCFIFNEIDSACNSRKQKDCFIEFTKECTKDDNICERKWLMLDMDCVKASGVSSTDAEVALAKEKAKDVYAYLKNNGFKEPVIAMSGNGIHLMYKIKLENDKENEILITDCLKALDILFSDKQVKIDTAVFNASRITKLYGTVARKGTDTSERPHRLSKILSVPEEIKVNDVALLIALAKTLPVAPKQPAYQNYSNNNKPQFNIDEFLSKYHIAVSQETSAGGMRKLILNECPFNSEHTGKDAAIFVQTNGAIGFKCLHSSCSSYTWQDVRKKYEPDAYAIRTTPRINSQKPVHIDKVPDEPDFYTADIITPRNKDNIVSIKTGFNKLDKRLIGLNKGDVSVVSGVNSSGKSSVICQMGLNIAQQKYRVAIFSGEMHENRVLDWLQLQAAGKQNTIQTSYEDYYYVKESDKKLINDWLKDKIYIYNNRKGNDINRILDSVHSCIRDKKVDLVVLDNLMAINLDGLSGDKYEKQSNFSKTIKAFGSDNDVHIALVAHPRKSIGFLRKDDIAGTADITNMVDNVFIVHRVNKDFIRLSGQMFGWKETDDIYKNSNVIEVCKNRDLGVQDLFVGLHYEKESKRFLNEPFEIKHYDWEDNIEYSLPFDI